MYLIKRERYRFSKDINFLPDKKRRIRLIVINYGWNTHIVHILREGHDGIFLLKGNFFSKLPKPVGISHEWIKTDFNYQEPDFYSRLFDGSKKIFEVPPGRTKKYYK